MDRSASFNYSINPLYMIINAASLLNLPISPSRNIIKDPWLAKEIWNSTDILQKKVTKSLDHVSHIQCKQCRNIVMYVKSSENGYQRPNLFDIVS